MWNKPWKLKEGLWIGIGLAATGLMLQWCCGAIRWNAFAYPVNIIVLAFFLVLIFAAHALRGKVYAFRWMSTWQAAVSSLIIVLLLTIVMGVVKQVPDHQEAIDFLGITRMLSFWPFVLLYMWMTVIVGLVTLRSLFAFKWRDVPFLLSHAGLFIVLVSATLGSADMQRLKMTVGMEHPEWRAIGNNGVIHELPIAIQLKRFFIDEYAPKLVLVNHLTGKTIPEKKAEMLLIDSVFTEGELGKWHIRLNKKYDMAAPVMTRDTTNYVEWHSAGACSAVHVTVESKKKTAGEGAFCKREGWITCGSYIFPYQLLKLNDSTSLAMPEREPQRFVSHVEILTKSGKHAVTDILVNKPFEIDGWKVYQLSYDESKGRWSEVSVLELVSDPWLPVVYTGISMMLLGALLMFLSAQKKKEVQA